MIFQIFRSFVLFGDAIWIYNYNKIFFEKWAIIKKYKV